MATILASVRGAERPTMWPLATAAIVAVTAIVLALAGGHGVATRSDRAAPANLAALTVRLTPSVARRTERVRGLEFKRIPEPEVATSNRLSRIEEREVERSGGTRGIAADEAEARIVGLLDDDEQLEAAVGATGELAAAAYDTRTDRLYVLSDAVEANRPLVEFVLAHELTHALEDQRFGIADVSGVDTDDAALARLALGEGSATSAMVTYAREYLSTTELLSALDTLDTGTGDVPAFVVDQLEWAYLGGLRFVDRLRALAGGWKLTDYAIEDRPPASTEQVIHPAKYVDDERPAPVAIAGAALRARGWRLADEGDLGELTTRQVLAVGLPPAPARGAAAGWDGDRYELWRQANPPSRCEATCRSALVLVLRWRWDSRRDAHQFARAAKRYVLSGLDGTPTARGQWRVADGAVALDASAGASTLVFAPDAALASRLAAGAGRESGVPGSAP